MADPIPDLELKHHKDGAELFVFSWAFMMVPVHTGVVWSCKEQQLEEAGSFPGSK